MKHSLKHSLALALLPLALAPLCPAQAHTDAPRAVTQNTTKAMLTVVYSFAEDDQQGQNALTVGADGALYGTAPYGGAVREGMVYKVTRGGLFHKLADLYPRNGILPAGPLLLMPNGALMGTTFYGGRYDTGALFLLTPPHRFQTKHEFAASRNGTNTQGAYPAGALALGTDGAVYGTAAGGGAAGGGVVYRWTAAHGIEVVHDFLGGKTDGEVPETGLRLGPDGALYGFTILGGANNQGTVYRLTTDGIFTVLHSFTKRDDIMARSGQLPTFGSDGAIYGTTPYSGTSNRGTFYRLTTDGTFTVLRSFTNNEAGYSIDQLTSGPDGALYCTFGGSTGPSTVFRLSLTGALTTVYTFNEATNGVGGSIYPLTLGPDGALYGFGSSNTQGGLVIFKLRLPQ